MLLSTSSQECSKHVTVAQLSNMGKGSKKTAVIQTV